LPNRGGVLTIINSLFWLGFAWFIEQPNGGAWTTHDWILRLSMPLLLYFSAPLLCPVTFAMRGNDAQSLIWNCVVLGINAFIWGYSLSAVWSSHEHRREKTRRFRMLATGHCPKCGYDIRATRERCPECGTATGLSRHVPLLDDAIARLESMH
jgi:hypothetical protein